MRIPVGFILTAAVLGIVFGLGFSAPSREAAREKNDYQQYCIALEERLSECEWIGYKVPEGESWHGAAIKSGFYPKMLRLNIRQDDFLNIVDKNVRNDGVDIRQPKPGQVIWFPKAPKDLAQY